MSNAGPGLSPNKQSQTGKISATNQHGDKVTAGYRVNGGNGRDHTHGPLPAGSLSVKATGMPQNNGPRPGSAKMFNTSQSKNTDQALGAPGKLTGR